MSKNAKETGGQPASRIDWRQIHARLENARNALNQRTVRTPEEKAAILKARARALAMEPVTDGAGYAQVEILEFLLAYETYAVESSFVREVYPLKEITPMPGTPSFVSGIINVRGQIVSVIDLKKFFDLPEKGLTDLNKVIILRDGKTEFGILADAMLTVRHISLNELQPSLPTLTGLRAEYLKGVTAGRLVVLDAAKLLADPRINICQTIETQP